MTSRAAWRAALFGAMLAWAAAVAADESALPAEEAADATPASPLPSVVDDAAVLRRLRQAIADTDPGWTADLPGWRPADDAEPCDWEGVECDQDGHVTAIKLVNMEPPSAAPVGAVELTAAAAAAAAAAANSSAPLLPELASLEALEELVLVRKAAPPWPLIPRQWLVPGTFPSLHRLSLSGHLLGAPLPDIPAGALPALARLHLDFPGLRSTLPASWGANPAVLPSLDDALVVNMQIAGALPAEWAAGFRYLAALILANRPASRGESAGPGMAQPQAEASAPSLDVGGSTSSTAGGAGSQWPPESEAAGAAARPGLPVDWAAGFPALELLALQNLPLGGPFPQAWAERGFGELTSLSLDRLGLTGTLPTRLFEAHPHLRDFSAAGNQLSGALPDAWAASQAATLSLANNSLAGPAFPPAWLASGAFRQLEKLHLGGNAGLGGALPADLSWPKLCTLKLLGTGVDGRVPEAWCRAPFAGGLRVLALPASGSSDTDGAGDDPFLPPCAARAFPSLEPKPWAAAAHGSGSGGGGGGPQLELHFGLTAALFVLCGMAVGATVAAFRAGLVYPRSLGQRTGAGAAGGNDTPRAEGLQRLLRWRHGYHHPPQQQQQQHFGGPGRRLGDALGGGWGLTRRDRLEALLNEELASGVPRPRPPGGSSYALPGAAGGGVGGGGRDSKGLELEMGAAAVAGMHGTEVQKGPAAPFGPG